MRKYFYIEDDLLADRNNGCAVLVYRMVRGKYPQFIGSNRNFSEQAKYDPLTEAKQVISRVEGYRMTNKFTLTNKSIEVRAL